MEIEPISKVQMKTSMSTAKSSGSLKRPISKGKITSSFSGALSGMTLNDVKSQKFFENDFDQYLSKTTGDLTAIVRVTNDNKLMDKVLGILKTIAKVINNSLHETK